MDTADSLKRSDVQIPLFLVALGAPFAIFYFLYSTSFGSIVIEDFLIHTVLIVITVSFSFYTAYYYYKLYTKSPRAPLLFASLSTFVFAAVFLAHGLIMPSAEVSPRSEMVFDIMEHYGLFLSALFFIGMAMSFVEGRGFLYRNRRRIYAGTVLAVVASIAVVFSSERVASVLYGMLDVVVGSTGTVLIALALFLARRFSKTRDLLLLYCIFGFTVMASSAYTALFYTEWNLIWWYSHLVFPIGYTAIFIGLINYERDDLDFNLFFGEIPFYKKIGTKLALTIFATGLFPLLVFGSLMFVSVGGSVNQSAFGDIIPSWIFVENADSPRFLVFRFALMIALLFVLSAFFSFYFASKLVFPLKRLREASSRIARGEESLYIEIKTGDEIESLANSFNTMGAELQQLHGGLEKKIREQTKELSERLSDLEKNKKAMFNLLEDSKLLEEQLAQEKEGVELKVVERTRELKEEHAKLLASIESLSFGFVIADTEDNVIVKNVAFSTILELTEEPTTLRNIVDTFKGVASGLDVLVHSCRECVDLKRVVELKEVLHGKKFLRVFCTPIIVKGEPAGDMQEKTIGYAMLVEDVTEAKIMERSRDEFFAVASHELRTPLTAIRGNADMILDMYADKVVDKDMKEMLMDIDISSVRLIAIVNEFLEVSRLEQGRIEIKKENFNVSEVINKVVRDLTAMIEEKGLSIAYTEPQFPLPEVFADKNRTEQIILNLIGNAAKFTKEGGITVTTNVVGGFVAIRVIDTGLGISERNQALLFRKFQQAGEQVLARDVTQSTGLGLYISKLIISSMGGIIGLEKSELGKGSTFVFTLPILK